jgi:hypothetical protein
MAEWLNHEVETYVGAIVAIFEVLGQKADPRKVFWANYPVLSLERNQLGEMVKKDTRKLEKELHDDLCQSRLWYVGVPRFKLVRRGVPHLSCEIDLYYVASDTTKGEYSACWFGKIMPKADAFDVPLCLVSPLLDVLQKGETETKEAHIVERGSGYAIYDFMGREWKIPDAFLGFMLALRDKGKDFEGLLDPVSCSLVDKFAKELPSTETPKLITDDDYQNIVTWLKEQMGYPKVKAEEAAKYVMDKVPNESLENKIKESL